MMNVFSYNCAPCMWKDNKGFSVLIEISAYSSRDEGVVHLP